MDLVCKKHKQTIYVQVRYLLESEEMIEREFRPLERIMDKCPKFIISRNQFDRTRDGIRNVNLRDFLIDYDLVK